MRYEGWNRRIYCRHSSVCNNTPKFFDESKTGLSQTLATHQGTLGELQENISQLFKEIQKGQEKNIEITLVDVRKALLAKQSELITAVASIEPSADTAVENKPASNNDTRMTCAVLLLLTFLMLLLRDQKHKAY